MDKIHVVDLEVFFCVGVTAAEREKPQRLLLSLELETNFAKATRTDSVQDTIDYGAVTERLLRLGEGKSWALIETLAEEVAALVSREFKPSSVFVEVKKFIIPQARHVAVSLRRP